jgi:glycine/D-amino acid oxidase-like deaminating enzyme
MNGTDRNVDILIVGNGALGIFLANELARRKLGEVTVVGPSSRFGGASRAAGAMLGCFCEVTSSTLSSDLGRRKFEISLEAHRRWKKLRAEISDVHSGAIHVVPDTFLILNSVRQPPGFGEL